MNLGIYFWEDAWVLKKSHWILISTFSDPAGLPVVIPRFSELQNQHKYHFMVFFFLFRKAQTSLAFLPKKKNPDMSGLFVLVLPVIPLGFEPRALSLKGRCSTDWATESVFLYICSAFSVIGLQIYRMLDTIQKTW